MQSRLTVKRYCNRVVTRALEGGHQASSEALESHDLKGVVRWHRRGLDRRGGKILLRVCGVVCGKMGVGIA